VFGDRTGDPIADRILEALASGGGELDRTAIHDLFDRNVSAERVDRAIELLERRSLTKITKKNTSARGRPRMVLTLASEYEINELNEKNPNGQVSVVVPLRPKSEGLTKKIPEPDEPHWHALASEAGDDEPF